jgi:hypothetical protein
LVLVVVDLVKVQTPFSVQLLLLVAVTVLVVTVVELI